MVKAPVRKSCFNTFIISVWFLYVAYSYFYAFYYQATGVNGQCQVIQQNTKGTTKYCGSEMETDKEKNNEQARLKKTMKQWKKKQKKEKNNLGLGVTTYFCQLLPYLVTVWEELFLWIHHSNNYINHV